MTAATQQTEGVETPRDIELAAAAKVRALEELATATRRARPLEGLVELVIDQVAEAIRIDGAAVWLHQSQGDIWYIGGSRGLTWRASQVQFPGDRSLLSRIDEEGEIVTDLACAGFRRLYPEHERIRGALYAPMTIAGRRVGLLALYRESEGPFTETDLRFARTTGAQVGVAISFAALEARSERLAVAEERARLGADLHDGVMQILSAVRVYAGELRRTLDAGAGAPDAAQLERIEGLGAEIESCLDEGSEEIRSVIESLRRPDVNLDVSRGLELARERLQAAGIATELVYELDEIPDEVADALTWIAREAASNIIRHSNADNATIELRATGRVVELLITDDGGGSGPKTWPAAGGATRNGAGNGPRGDGGAQLGLRLMRERAEQLGGSFSIEPQQAGMHLRVRVPTAGPPPPTWMPPA